MKKVTILLLTALMTACSNNTDNDPQPVEYGTISLGIGNDESVTVSPRAAATDDELADYTIKILQNSEQKNTFVYKNRPNPITVAAGAGYVVAAESCDEYAAESANENWGQARYAGASSSFEVKANQDNVATLTCSMANMQVSVTWDSSIANTDKFTDYSLTMQKSTNASRTLTFNSSTTDKSAFFNVEASATLTGTISYTFNGQPKSASITSIALVAKKHAKLTVKASDTGALTLVITIDKSVTEKPLEETINPYGE